MIEMPEANDPRVYFAAERTLLAWLRTGLGIVGLGFVVSRFGLFLRLVAHPKAEESQAIGSAGIGVCLVLVGGLVIVGATVQHVRFRRGLTPGELPLGYWTGFAVWSSVLVAAMIFALAAYLASA